LGITVGMRQMYSRVGNASNIVSLEGGHNLARDQLRLCDF